MADNIIRLRGSPHEQTQMLLPWYVNETLEPHEKAEVESHLANCIECRTDVEAEGALAADVAAIPLEAAQGWATLANRLDSIELNEKPNPLLSVPILRRPIRLGWAVGIQAIAAVLVAVVITSMPEVPKEPVYHALGNGSVAASANIVVLFDPETSEHAMRAALVEVDARLVDGPTATGAYMAHVLPERREAALTILRQTRQVVVAEPIDPGMAP